VPLEPPLYGSFRYRPATHPYGLKQAGRLTFHFAYSGWLSDTVASSTRHLSRIMN